MISVEGIGLNESRRPAHIVAAVILMGLAALGVVMITVPTTPLITAPTAIGGGPPADIHESGLGVDCVTPDGAPYEADSC